MKTPLSLAVILAAGRGTRMGEDGKVKPKGFITVGGKPIVEESVLKLKRNGFTEIIIVTGHCHQHYERLAQNYPELIRLVHNQHFADSGSMYSLYIAESIVGRRPFLLLESDIIYEERSIPEICRQPQDDVILVSGFTGSGDEVYVAEKQGVLVDLSKRREDLAGMPAGELVGIAKLSFKVFAEMVNVARQVFVSSRHMEYEKAMVVAAKSFPVHCHVLRDLVWGEIDNKEHLDRVRNEIFPRIQHLDATESKRDHSGRKS